MIMEPCAALKKIHMYLSHCLHKLLQFYRPQLRSGQSEWWFCVFLKCLSTEVAAKTKALRLNMQPTATYSSRVMDGDFEVRPHPLPAGFEVTLTPCTSAPLPVFVWDSKGEG